MTDRVSVRELAAGLAEDLQTVREIVASAAESSTRDAAAIDRLEREIAWIHRERDEAMAALGRAEVALNRAQAEQTIVITADEIASLSDVQVRIAARARVRAAAMVLDKARYQGDAREVWDLITILARRDPVIEAVARALLGQGVV